MWRETEGLMLRWGDSFVAGRVMSWEGGKGRRVVSWESGKVRE